MDSIGKKINVVKEISSSLNLNNVTAIKSRAEDMKVRGDFIVSRAVANLSELYIWTKHLLRPGGTNAMKNGWVFLKGGDLNDEILTLNRPVVEIDINLYFQEDFFNTKKIIYFN